MEYRSLGTSGLKVPVLCLGAMTFGEADEDLVIGSIRHPTHRPSRPRAS
jgi:aryl-alcohol dehydrogenase-like predicted oxidoreductase